MRRTIGIGIALCGCVAASRKSEPSSSGALANVASQPAPACVKWTASEVMSTRNGSPVYVEAPSAVRLTTGTALFGYPAIIWASPDATWAADSSLRNPVAVGVVFGRNRSLMPILPPGEPAERPYDVMAVSDGRGGAHMFWTTSPRGSNAPRLVSTRVIGAHFDGKGWSPSEDVLVADVIRWNRATAAVVAPDGEAYFVVSGSRAASEGLGGGIAYVRGRAGRWTTSWISTRSLPPGYVALHAKPGHPWVVAFIGSVETGALNVNNGAFAVVSRDDGHTWSEIVPVRDLGNDVAHRVQLVGTPNGLLHMLWEVQARGATAITRIEHWTSRDGLAWQRATDLTVANGIAGFQSAVTPSGVLIVVYLQLEGMHLRATDWDGKTWVSDVALGDDRASTEPSVVRLAADSLYVVWGGVRPSAPVGNQLVGDAPVSRWARRTSECDRPQ